MSDYLDYDGQTLTWMPGGLTYRATSGLRGAQTPSKQCSPDEGPIPEGTYYLLLRMDRQEYAKDDGTSRCKLRPGSAIQFIPRGGDPNVAPKGDQAGECEDPYWANWGWRRVRLEAADRATVTACFPRRGGFYLHDSSKGYSHGCIEVEQPFFNQLLSFVKKTTQTRMLLRVAYTKPSTYGGTLNPSAKAPSGR